MSQEARMSQETDELLEAVEAAVGATTSVPGRPAEPGQRSAEPDDGDGDEFDGDEAGRAARFLGAVGAAASKGADAVLDGGRATGSALASAGSTVGSAFVTAGSAAGSALGSAASATAQAVDAAAQAAADAARRWTSSVIGAAQGLLASDLSDTFNSLVQAAVKGPATVYDKAMDAEFISTGIGGMHHRLFDGGHTVSGAWQAARGVSAEDSLIEEMLGTVQGLLRDVSTPMGLPLANWDKETFDAVAESLQSSFGIPRSWFADLVSYDAAELLGGTVGVVATIFNWNKADTETFASLAASMGLSATLSANPLLLPVSVVALARAYHKAKSDGSYSDVADGAFKGALTSGASMGAVALVGVAGGPAGVALLAGLSAAALAHAAAKNVEFADVHEFVKNDVTTALKQFTEKAGDIGQATAEYAAGAGRMAWNGMTDAAEWAADSAQAVGGSAADHMAGAARATAGAAVAAGKATADAARAAGRSGTAAAAKTAASARSAAVSATQRAKELVGRDKPEYDEPADTGTGQPETSED